MSLIINTWLLLPPDRLLVSLLNVICDDSPSILLFNLLKNSKHLFLVDDEALYAVPDSYAYIEKYNAETGVLEERLDLSSVPFIKGNIQYAESQAVANNSYFIHVMDACL